MVFVTVRCSGHDLIHGIAVRGLIAMAEFFPAHGADLAVDEDLAVLHKELGLTARFGGPGVFQQIRKADELGINLNVLCNSFYPLLHPAG